MPGFKADVTETPVKRHTEIQMRLLGELNRTDRAKTEMIALLCYKGRCGRALNCQVSVRFLKDTSSLKCCVFFGVF